MISKCCHQRLQFELEANALVLAAGETNQLHSGIYPDKS
jgi:hypothetical protein